MGVSHSFYFYHYLGKIPIWSHIFHVGLKPPTSFLLLWNKDCCFKTLFLKKDSKIMTLCGQSHGLTEIRPCVLAVTVSKLNGNMVIVVSGHLLKSEMQVSRLPGPGILLCSTSMCYHFRQMSPYLGWLSLVKYPTNNRVLFGTCGLFSSRTNLKH